MKKTVIQFILKIVDGGAESLVRDYALLMNKDNLNVIIVSLLPPDELSSNYRLLKENGIKIYTLLDKYPFFKQKLLQRIWCKFFSVRYCSRRLYSICIKEHVCCIHVHLEILKYLQPLSNKLSRLNIRLLYTCHSLPSRYFNTNDKLSELKAARKLIHNNDLLIIALHSDMKRELSELLNTDNVIVVPNGVDFARFSNIVESKIQIRESLKIPTNSYVVGHIGRFTPVKNHKFIIQVFINILKSRPDAFLLLVGNGSTLNEVEEMLTQYRLRERAIILSHRSDVPRILKSMDVFIFPSFYEGFPVSLVEAQLAKLRIVMSDSITPDCIFNTNVIRLSLQEAPEIWSNAALNESLKGSISNDIKSFDMRSVIKELELLYIGDGYKKY